MAKLSCVIPAYNEAESLPHLWERLRPVLEQFQDWEVIVVSDGSTDGTNEVVKKMSEQDQRVQLVLLRRNQGKSAALMAGFQATSGEIIVTLDADLQDEPTEIPKLLEKLESGPYDMVGGWKKERHDPFVKVVSSKVFNALANHITGTHFHDLNCGFKIYRREAALALDLYGDLYRFIPILVASQGFRVTEMPVKHNAREHGQSKYGLRLNGVFDLISLSLITNYRWRPLHFFGRWGAFAFTIGILILLYLVVVHFMGQAIGDRPLLIFGVLFVLTGLQLLFTGLLGDLILHHGRKK